MEQYTEMVKKAALLPPSSFGSFVNRYAFIPIAGIATAVAAKESLIDPIRDHYKMKSSYNQLLKKTPQLKGVDSEQLRDYFNVVKTFSPKAASNPLVAGALVNKMVQFGGVDHKLVQDIADIQKGFDKTKIIEKAIETAAGTFGSIAKE